jgi:transcriptional regulator with XRE-family HTH domain
MRLASVIRTLRIRKGWRQDDLAAAAGATRASVMKVEHSRAGDLPLARTRAICAALDVRLDMVPRWRGGDLDRVLNARHSAMAESVAVAFGRLPGWIIRPEVSFSIYGERGVIDFVAWHPVRRALLLLELKTGLVDVGEPLATADRRRRLAPRIGREQGWDPVVVGSWIAILDTSTNADRIRRHRELLRTAFPAGGRPMSRWLRNPSGPISSLSLRSIPELRNARAGLAKRVRMPRNGDFGPELSTNRSPSRLDGPDRTA